MNEAAATISWLPSREVVVRVARHLGYPTENARQRIVRYVRARRITRGRTAEGWLVSLFPATWREGADLDAANLELCLGELIVADLLLASGGSKGPAERARQPADRAIAYLIMGYLVEWRDWTPEMIREMERGEIKLGEVIGADQVPAWGRRSPFAQKEPIPADNFHPTMIENKRPPVSVAHQPKVVVDIAGHVTTWPRQRWEDYRGPRWQAIEVDSAALRQAGPRPMTTQAEFEPALPTEPPRVKLVPPPPASVPPPPPESSSPAPATPKTLPDTLEMILSVLGLKGFQQEAIAEGVLEIYGRNPPESLTPGELRKGLKARHKVKVAEAKARGDPPPDEPAKWDACNDFVTALRAWRANGA